MVVLSEVLLTNGVYTHACSEQIGDWHEEVAFNAVQGFSQVSGGIVEGYRNSLEYKEN
jgi:hypothetical protein